MLSTSTSSTISFCLLFHIRSSMTSCIVLSLATSYQLYPIPLSRTLLIISIRFTICIFSIYSANFVLTEDCKTDSYTKFVVCRQLQYRYSINNMFVYLNSSTRDLLRAIFAWKLPLSKTAICSPPSIISPGLFRLVRYSRLSNELFVDFNAQAGT